MAIARRRVNEEFPADCQPSDTVGMFVYVTGPEVAGIAQVTKVDITTTGKYPAVGVIVSKSSPTRCLVRVTGEYVTSIALTPGKPYFVSLTGSLTAVPPVPGAGRAAVQVVGTAIGINRLRLIVFPQLFLKSS